MCKTHEPKSGPLLSGYYYQLSCCKLYLSVHRLNFSHDIWHNRELHNGLNGGPFKASGLLTNEATAKYFRLSPKTIR